ncbi:DNA replication factor C [Spathaspora passalidarum NRRL Y-27907]|uniref:Replication factor C subunit 5 n=1 Tax=Spathaspora passalidarum (strain NRRL Y-27907 / 11-Y1) TaxID=619300 RepID=G3AKU2_SPAPN|nr:DNA replication factor C [Spathaspora passalidarum NRRL Y-27907]EGW33642.1 DNA replication factor C [Spathaspora passalidarum NRRL Y-27907]
MSLWVDKYRPKTLDQLLYHDSITQSLKALSKSGDFPHLLIYGPSGAGKKTRIYCTLNEIFGSSVEKLKIDVKTFVTSSNRKLEFNVLSSPYHLEITPSDMGNNDRVVIQDLLKDIASTEQVDFNNQSSSKTKHRFKIVIINEADSLSRDAQAALRRTMEKYSSNIRLILVCNSISNIIAPIKSRTLLVRIPSPSITDINSILSNISVKEGIKFSSNDLEPFYTKVSTASNRNLRRALLSFETLTMQNETIKPETNLSIINLDWEVIIKNIANNIKTARNVATLAKIRTVFYELLSHCIPARIILKTLLFNLIEIIPDVRVVQELVNLASVFDERLSLGQKSIFHLEGFVAKSMVTIDQYN